MRRELYLHGFITEKQSKEYSKNGHAAIRYPLAGAYSFSLYRYYYLLFLHLSYFVQDTAALLINILTAVVT
jgi:hypothetical protein